jgi:hypothetical protein
MKKITLAATLLLGCISHSFAQTDTATVKKEKLVDMYIGVQMNELISQVFNFNNTNTTSQNTNPYLVNYSLNSRKSGWGFRVGVGYNYSSTSTNDGITATTTKLNDLEFRIGVDKAYKISKKWSAGIGLDFVMNNNSDHTTNVVNGGVGFGNSDSTDTKTTILSYGGGPMGWLRYHVSDRILIGTESSFYYTTGKTTQNITDNGIATTPVTSNNTGQGTLSVPVVFYLIVKF